MPTIIAIKHSAFVNNIYNGLIPDTNVYGNKLNLEVSSYQPVFDPHVIGQTRLGIHFEFDVFKDNSIFIRRSYPDGNMMSMDHTVPRSITMRGGIVNVRGRYTHQPSYSIQDQ